MATIDDRIRTVLADHARLPDGIDGIGDDADLFVLGMTSHASVNVMLGIEDEFDVEFPEHLLRKSTFESIAAIRAAVVELGADG